MQMGETYENVFRGAYCWANSRLLSETFLRENSHLVTFFMDFTQ